MDVNKSVKAFIFDDDNTGETLVMTVYEYVDPSYGMYIWPSSPVLAQYVWHNRNFVKDKTVLEIGAGTALPGLTAAKCGACVYLTDSAFSPKCFELCRDNIQANDLKENDNLKIFSLTWGMFCPNVLTLKPVDIILGSDCFYDPDVFEAILVTISFIFTKYPKARFWCTYQERSADWTIRHLLKKWNLSCRAVSLESFDAEGGNIAGSNMPGRHEIRMFEIAKEHQESD
ncbi:histone-arginine methyltransferase METTL23-like [Centruroides vittatus]|uniref:histone-arginine methyltransferase METTL23-like n=1 Tax=Centruroides vittatus TaxID=120091 RepID=UPI0035106F64